MKVQRRRLLQLAGAAAVMRPFGTLAIPVLKLRVGRGPGMAATWARHKGGAPDGN
jgi:hypothetical protein